MFICFAHIPGYNQPIIRVGRQLLQGLFLCLPDVIGKVCVKLAGVQPLVLWHCAQSVGKPLARWFGIVGVLRSLLWQPTHVVAHGTLV